MTESRITNDISLVGKVGLRNVSSLLPHQHTQAAQRRIFYPAIGQDLLRQVLSGSSGLQICRDSPWSPISGDDRARILSGDHPR